MAKPQRANPFKALKQRIDTKPTGARLEGGTVTAKDADAWTVDVNVKGVTIPDVSVAGSLPNVGSKVWLIRQGSTLVCVGGVLSSDTFFSDIIARGGPGGIQLKSTAPSDHAFMAFYPRDADPDERWGYFGYPSVGHTDLHLAAEQGGDLVLIASNGAGQVKVDNGSDLNIDGGDLLKNGTKVPRLVDWGEMSSSSTLTCTVATWNDVLTRTVTGLSSSKTYIVKYDALITGQTGRWTSRVRAGSYSRFGTLANADAASASDWATLGLTGVATLSGVTSIPIAVQAYPYDGNHDVHRRTASYLVYEV